VAFFVKFNRFVKWRSNDWVITKSYFKKSQAMWNTNSLWLEVSIVSVFFLVGNIYFGHFEERSPKWRKVLKYFITLAIIVSVSFFFGRAFAFGLLALSTVPILYVHGIVLPKKGINGWTGEPKSKYYDFRGWDKNIFADRD
jgi:hypothetical protein